jgi:hypothetical protein
MLGTQRLLLPFFVLGLCLVASGLDPQAAEKRGSIYGTSNANLSADPGLNQPSPPATKPAEQNAPAAKSPSLIQLLEGRETDMVLWSAIAVAFFFIGWICGGNFYLRRDRKRRTKLRF